MVAKSYQGKEIVGEPYVVTTSKRGDVMYVKIKTGKTSPDGTPVVKEVRWYTEDEYYKMYPNDRPQIVFDPKQGFGFDEGYIWIFKGDTYAHLDWFKECPVTQYATHLGWFVKSRHELPEDVPADLTPVKLMWEQVTDGNDHMLPDEQIKEIVRNITNPINTESRYQGTIGGKLTLVATCTLRREVVGPFGPSTLHNFVDADNNLYVWFTQAKQLTVGQTYSFSCKVKDHKEYRGQQQTLIYYLRNIKEVNND